MLFLVFFAGVFRAEATPAFEPHPSTLAGSVVTGALIPGDDDTGWGG
jgi:hypothetical protein